MEGKSCFLSIITGFLKFLQLVLDNLLVIVGQLLPAFDILRGILDPLCAGALFREHLEQASDVVPGWHQFAVREETRHILGDPYLVLFNRTFALLAFRAAGFRALHSERFLFPLLLLILIVSWHDVQRGWQNRI